MSNEYEVIKIDRDDMVRLKVKVKRKVPYDKIIELMVEGHEVFIPDIDRRVAWHVKKRLSKMIGAEVIAYPSEFQGMSGYLFKISLVEQLLKMNQKNN